MEGANPDPVVRTKVLILSDTHGMDLDDNMPLQPVDMAIHCGDLTEESKLTEFHSTLRFLNALDARLELVIAGNQDFTLDTPSFQKKVDEASPPLEAAIVAKEYGHYGEAKQLLSEAQEQGIMFLEEGTYQFPLENGALLTVYASPYTPSLGDWGFQYRQNQGHAYVIENGTDIVITHGPPRGVLDRTTSREGAGSSEIFTAVARAKPQIHCFGHIHEGWGAKLVAWRDKLSDMEHPSHLTDINNEDSTVLELLGTLRRSKFDTPEIASEKEQRATEYARQKFCDVKSHIEAGKQTLFVNASIKGDEGMPTQLPWIVDLDLPKHQDTGKDEAKTADEPRLSKK